MLKFKELRLWHYNVSRGVPVSKLEMSLLRLHLFFRLSFYYDLRSSFTLQSPQCQYNVAQRVRRGKTLAEDLKCAYILSIKEQHARVCVTFKQCYNKMKSSSIKCPHSVQSKSTHSFFKLEPLNFGVAVACLIDS